MVVAIGKSNHEVPKIFQGYRREGNNSAAEMLVGREPRGLIRSV